MKTIFANNTKVQLTQNDYKGAGGEGEIFVKAGKAYKIYHDPAKMIPVGKIHELSQLKLPNVLAPLYPIQDGQSQPIGFAMPYVSDTEYLVKLFTRGFRDKNGITPDIINAIVKRMQNTAKAIHTHKVLIVDANEMNFLASKKFDEVFFIDTDSYQTPSYPATAIMDSIRDRKVKNNQFTTLSDWYSLGVVFFQLYMGTHPYKGRHPDYGRDWVKMMDDSVSVFNKKCHLPPNCQDWSVIPAGHKRWFEAIFEKGERLPPPEPDYVAATTGATTPQIIASNSKFELTLLRKYDGIIEGVRSIDGITYVYTDKSIYADQKVMSAHALQSGYTAKRTYHDFVPAQGDLPVIIEHNSLMSKLSYKSLDGKLDDHVNSDGYFVANGQLYTVVHGGLVEISFANFGVKTIASRQSVAQIFDNHKIFDGFVLQDMLGTCRAAIPYKAGTAKTIHIPELDKARIVDAKYMDGVAIVIAEGDGDYNRLTFVFDKSMANYTVREEKNVAVQDVNFTVMDKGVCVAANGDNIEVFMDNSKVKVIPNSPLTNNQDLLSWSNKIYVTNKDSIYHLAMK